MSDTRGDLVRPDLSQIVESRNNGQIIFPLRQFVSDVYNNRITKQPDGALCWQKPDRFGVENRLTIPFFDPNNPQDLTDNTPRLFIFPSMNTDLRHQLLTVLCPDVSRRAFSGGVSTDALWDSLSKSNFTIKVNEREIAIPTKIPGMFALLDTSGFVSMLITENGFDNLLERIQRLRSQGLSEEGIWMSLLSDDDMDRQTGIGKGNQKQQVDLLPEAQDVEAKTPKALIKNLVNFAERLAQQGENPYSRACASDILYNLTGFLCKIAEGKYKWSRHGIILAKTPQTLANREMQEVGVGFDRAFRNDATNVEKVLAHLAREGFIDSRVLTFLKPLFNAALNGLYDFEALQESLDDDKTRALLGEIGVRVMRSWDVGGERMEIKTAVPGAEIVLYGGIGHDLRLFFDSSVIQSLTDDLHRLTGYRTLQEAQKALTTQFLREFGLDSN